MAAALQQRLLFSLQEATEHSTIKSVKNKPWLYQEIFLSIRLEISKDKIIPKVPVILLILQVSLYSLMNVPSD